MEVVSTTARARKEGKVPRNEMAGPDCLVVLAIGEAFECVPRAQRRRVRAHEQTDDRPSFRPQLAPRTDLPDYPKCRGVGVLYLHCPPPQMSSLRPPVRPRPSSVPLVVVAFLTLVILPAAAAAAHAETQAKQANKVRTCDCRKRTACQNEAKRGNANSSRNPNSMQQRPPPTTPARCCSKSGWCSSPASLAPACPARITILLDSGAHQR